MSSIYESLSKASSLKPEQENVHLNIPRHPQIIKPPKESASSGGSRAAYALLFVLAALALGAAAYCFLVLTTGQQKQQTLETKYQQLMGFSQSLEARTAEYRNEIEQVRNQLDTMSVEKADLQKEVSRSRIEISNLEKTVLDIQERNRKLDQEAARLKQAAAGVLGEGVSLAENIQATPVSFQPVLQQSAVPAPLVPAAPGSSAPAAVEKKPAETVALQGTPAITSPQVMTVNRKFNFAVINIGMKDKLKMGDRLRVERGGKSIGTVEVEKLYDSFSAATIIEEKKSQPIQEGDSVEKA